MRSASVPLPSFGESMVAARASPLVPLMPGVPASLPCPSSGTAAASIDSTASGEVLELLRRAVDDFGQTVVMVTHDAYAASHSDRLVVLADGRIVHDGAAPAADGVLDLMKSLS